MAAETVVLGFMKRESLPCLEVEDSTSRFTFERVSLVYTRPEL